MYCCFTACFIFVRQVECSSQPSPRAQPSRMTCVLIMSSDQISLDCPFSMFAIRWDNMRIRRIVEVALLSYICLYICSACFFNDNIRRCCNNNYTSSHPQLLYPGFVRTALNQASNMKAVAVFARSMGWKQVIMCID
jgi:hypothetical protein